MPSTYIYFLLDRAGVGFLFIGHVVIFGCEKSDSTIPWILFETRASPALYGRTVDGFSYMPPRC